MAWENFLNTIIEAREENGEEELKKPELERIILHNFLIHKIKKDMISLKITKREKVWMRG